MKTSGFEKITNNIEREVVSKEACCSIRIREGPPCKNVNSKAKNKFIKIMR